MSKKIVIAQDLDLLSDQVERLNKLGEVKFYDDLAKTHEDWVERVKDADIICSGKFGLKQKYLELSDKLISVPFVGVGWFDAKKAKEKNVFLAKSPGCNKVAVSEWIIGMLLNLFRELPEYINVKELPRLPERTSSLHNKKVCILGKGNIGERVGKICEALEMNVDYFLREDNLLEKISVADVVINCLSDNPTTQNILNKDFFKALKQDSYFISVTSSKLLDINAMITELDSGHIKKVAIDSGSIQVGDVKDLEYIKLANHPKILATPHIAYNTDNTARVGNDMMIDNIEAWINGKPTNVIE